MFQEMMVASGGGDNSFYKEENVPYSADKTITCPFNPDIVILVLYTPNYGSSHYHLMAHETRTNTGQSYLDQQGNVSYLAIPYTSMGGVIKNISGNNVTIGYNSNLGANQTYDLYAIKYSG